MRILETGMTLVLATGTALAQGSAVKPYTMVQTTTTTRTYANGMSSTETLKVVSMRDSQRRTRYEREQEGIPAMDIERDGHTIHNLGMDKWTSFSIFDPVQGITMNWNDNLPGNKEVRLTHTRSPSAARHVSPQPAQKPRDALVATEHVEKLGTRAIQGVIAEGTKTTTQYPAGAFGMSQAFTATREYWIARDYNFLAEETLDDPRMGHTVTTLVSFSDQEPDSSQFKAPEGYTVLSDNRVEAVEVKRQ